MASSSSTSLSFSLLLLLSLLSVSSAKSIPRAAAILSDSGFKSMSLALDLASLFLNSPSPSLTVFAPPDAAFAAAAGQPSLDLIRLHLSPVAFPLRSLKSLPFGAKIATLLDGSSLAVTSSPADSRVSLNNVTVTAAPIFDDGELIIFGIESFFDRSFLISAPIDGCLEPPNSNEAMADETAAFYLFGEAIKVLEDPLSPTLGPIRKPNTEPSSVECECECVCSSSSKPLWWNVGSKVMAFAILAVVDKTTRSVFGWSLLFWVLQVDSAGWRRRRSKRLN